MKEYRAYLDTKGIGYLGSPDEFNNLLKDFGYELQPSEGTSTTWKRITEYGEHVIEDFIYLLDKAVVLSHAGPGKYAIYKVHSLPSDGLVEAVPEEKEDEYEFVNLLGCYRPKVHPGDKIKPHLWSSHVDSLKSDLEDIFEFYDYGN